MAKRLTKDEWAAARILWESDNEQTDASISERYGVSKQAVVQKRQRDQWQKIGALHSAGQRAQFMADSKSCQNIALGNIKSDSVDLAVEIRADVIDRHRGDWAEHRKHFTVSSISDDFEMGKKAKITAEMLKIRQEGERKAYGLDDVTNTPSTSIADAMAELAQRLPR